MKLVSVNVGTPREVEFDGRRVRSSIWKEPVGGAVALGELGLAGDRQATAVVHGGIHKAAYAYSLDRYAWWRKELGREDLGHGMFGENLTISGLDDSTARIGDQWAIGDVRLIITGPRIPCNNLAVKFGDKSVPRRFADGGWCGVYLRVLETGSLQAGDAIETLEQGAGPGISGIFRAYTRPREPGSRALLEQALENPWTDPEFADGVSKRLKVLKPNAAEMK